MVSFRERVFRNFILERVKRPIRESGGVGGCKVGKGYILSVFDLSVRLESNRSGRSQVESKSLYFEKYNQN